MRKKGHSCSCVFFFFCVADVKLLDYFHVEETNCFIIELNTFIVFASFFFVCVDKRTETSNLSVTHKLSSKHMAKKPNRRKKKSSLPETIVFSFT